MVSLSLSNNNYQWRSTTRKWRRQKRRVEGIISIHGPYCIYLCNARVRSVLGESVIRIRAHQFHYGPSLSQGLVSVHKREWRREDTEGMSLMQ
jgi:hypothetical protein